MFVAFYISREEIFVLERQCSSTFVMESNESLANLAQNMIIIHLNMIVTQILKLFLQLYGNCYGNNQLFVLNLVTFHQNKLLNTFCVPRF